MEKEENIKSINEDIARRFASIEDKLRNVSDIVSLFETLFDEVEKQFNIPFVWLSLIKSDKIAPIIKAVKSSHKLQTRLNLISKELFEKLISDDTKPFLVNRKLKPYYKLFPERKKYFVKSIAVVPLCVNDEVIGSWNNGDASPERYSPDMDTDFLQRFARLISLRLKELTNFNS